VFRRPYKFASLAATGYTVRINDPKFQIDVAGVGARLAPSE